ncbi:MAG: hypothetical protein IJA97_06375 [Clostridia bacterium]|nr:hypothetical protein [Clostridia bacterium]
MEILFEFVLDVVFDLYDDIVSYFFPDRVVSKGKRILLRLLCVLITLINVSLLFVGVWFITSGRLALGILLTSIGGALIIAHVIFAIILNIKTSRR